MVKNPEQKESKPLNVPKIIIDNNPQEEVEKFYWALHNKSRPWMRRSILNFRGFHSLKKSLESGAVESEEQEKQVIGNFLTESRGKTKERIEGFLVISQQELEEKSDKALAALAHLMDYEWPEDFPGYRVVPVLLPFSPFGENVFFFSVIGAAQGVKQKVVLDVAIHEISHMIFFEILKKSRPDLVNYRDPINVPIDYLKEILAPVLMNQPPLQELLDLSDHPQGYFGNSDLEEIYVIEGDSGEKVQISRYFQELYERMRYKEHKTFPEIIDVMLKLVQAIEDELIIRRNLWTEQICWKVLENDELLKAYAKPIMIDASH